jgi:CRISPR-associated DxTHG motif protein
VLDVTHGYRSLPVLALMAAAYLRVAADITVSKVVYGAYDARQDDRAPVFDLTPFLELLEWTSATEQFVRAGNAEPIAALLERVQDAAYRGGSALGHAPRNLKPAATQVRALSQSLKVLRPAYTCQSAQKLDAALHKADPEIPHWARPFGVLLRQVRDVAQQFFPRDASDPIGTHLEVQHKMLEWYLKHERYVHAGLLMRELVVSLVMAKNGLAVFNHDERERVEKEINARSRQQRKEPAAEERQPASPQPIDVPASILKLWDPLTQLRNDLAHAKDESPPDSVITQVRKLAQKVQALA